MSTTTTTKQQQRKEAAAAKRAEVQAKAAEAVQRIETDPDTAARFEALADRLPAYSLKNLQLIFAQFPEASMCAGFNKWREEGRTVRKGERGIKIFAPTQRTKKDEKGAPIIDRATGEPEKEAGWVMVTVFDISQTDELTD
ncbi:hypothetical protein KocCE7_12820 (plasmid) [Kocuria marina subsp. indica]|uniref:ArdC family protein n=1 Tax=Kocuria marina TaxID=223184 RepID=UPI00103B2876|nr:ArdC family protein [Kocuria indica]QBJ22777.1 hypothetical protein KocCE7_12820 [Kocuria indica]